MNRQAQIAAFVDGHITLPRMVQRYGLYAEPDSGGSRPTVEQLADELLALSEFRALQLGNWLGTTQGEVIAQAVEMVTPPFYRQDVELLVAALKHATRLQSQEGRRAAGKFALSAMGVACLAGFFIWSMEHGSAGA